MVTSSPEKRLDRHARSPPAPTAPFACRCQPQNGRPSYSTVSLYRGIGLLIRTLQTGVAKATSIGKLLEAALGQAPAAMKAAPA
jgi:hypothetical protein